MGWKSTNVNGRKMWERSDGMRVNSHQAIEAIKLSEKKAHEQATTYNTRPYIDEEEVSEDEPMHPIAVIVLIILMIWMIIDLTPNT